MKNRFLNRLAVACCFVIASTVCASSAPLDDCEPLEWRGEIYPDNKDYIKVALNAQKMPQNNYLQSVSFQFTFFDEQRRQLATEDISFADEPPQGLDPAFYEIYLKHSYRFASSIGGKMAYFCKRRGLALFSLKATVPIKEAKWEEYPAANDITVIGAPSGTQPSNQPSKERAGCDYAGFWRNTDGNLGDIQFLEIVAVAPGRLQIQAWLRCSPTPARGGTIKDCLEWGKDEVSITNFDNVIWKHDEPQELGQPPGPITRTTVTFTHSLTLDGDTLKVHVDKFGGEFNYFKRGTKP